MVEALVEHDRAQEEKQRVKRRERADRIVAGSREVVREALPNALGTIMGGAVLAVAGSALGLFSGLGTQGYILAAFLIGLPFVLLSDMRADRNCFNEGASRREAERTVQAMLDAGIVSDTPGVTRRTTPPESEPAD